MTRPEVDGCGRGHLAAVNVNIKRRGDIFFFFFNSYANKQRLPNIEKDKYWEIFDNVEIFFHLICIWGGVSVVCCRCFVGRPILIEITIEIPIFQLVWIHLRSCQSKVANFCWKLTNISRNWSEIGQILLKLVKFCWNLWKLDEIYQNLRKHWPKLVEIDEN